VARHLFYSELRNNGPKEAKHFGDLAQYFVLPTLDYTVGLLKLLINTYEVKIYHYKISSEMGGN
jgi:hypothetical protein